MKTRFAIAAILAAAVPTTAAQAQSFFSCKGNNGEFWGLYRVEGQTLKLWNPGTGWSGNLCAERSCTISADLIEMRWNSRFDGPYAYTLQAHTFTVNRRSGTAATRYVGDQWGHDGTPYTPNGWDPHSDISKAGTCQKGEDPEGGPPKF
jgi:hypothetical protein